jgi:prophage regulatory protein
MTEPLRLLRLPQVIDRVGLRRSRLYQKVAAGEFPAPVRISANAIGWLEHEVNRWIERRIEDSRAGDSR